jgi:hypothetical protein
MAIETDDCNIAEFLVPPSIVHSVSNHSHSQLMAAHRANAKQTAPPASALVQTISTGTCVVLVIANKSQHCPLETHNPVGNAEFNRLFK